ncbi:ribonuclease Y [Candidatus Saccharibacteria bacterium]|nr:ribonuclease Y [Candidatus Saccharibacteria bacterium]
MEPITIVLALVGVAAGFGASQAQSKKKLGSVQQEADKRLDKAKKEADKLLSDAKEEQHRILDEVRKEETKRRKDISALEERLVERESNLDKKLDELDKRTEKLRKEEVEITELKDAIRDIRTKQQEKLEKIAKLKKSEAADKLMEMTERDIREDLKGLVAKLQNEARDQADENAAAVLVGAMERMASEVTAERTITAVKLEDEDMKGRIIGKEGRNIQSLQRATGVDILVDDTPGMIILSCFDPVRREVARQALEMLMKDGRIHPGRIEEVVEKAQVQVQKDVTKAAEDAAREVGIVGIPKEVLQLLGELRFRTSYGQNVLKHSVEMAQIAGVLAEQIGADVKICKYAALVHDLGKSLTHKMEGKHHHLSGEMLRKYGVPEEIAHAAEAHHDDVEATTIEAMVVRVVDAVRAARPGARNISAENFIERMKDLENVANSFPGIEKSYAISAGREIRIFVKPQDLDDLQSIKVARDIATKIESTMQYPGTIKVNVIRETRAIEFAK